jgi:hypothetical protein
VTHEQRRNASNGDMRATATREQRRQLYILRGVSRSLACRRLVCTPSFFMIVRNARVAFHRDHVLLCPAETTIVLFLSLVDARRRNLGTHSPRSARGSFRCLQKGPFLFLYGCVVLIITWYPSPYDCPRSRHNVHLLGPFLLIIIP